jgi:hypothetical protein
MTLFTDFLNTARGHYAIVGLLLATGIVAILWQHRSRPAPAVPSVKPASPLLLPRTYTREGVRVPKPLTPSGNVSPSGATMAPTGARLAPVAKAQVLPITLFAAGPEKPKAPKAPVAPFGRLIPCQTIVTLESNRLETPVIGLVIEDVWHDGLLVVPAGAEVHGRAALDRTRERLAVEGKWRIVWRTPSPDNGTEVAVSGLALDREIDGPTGRWGINDGSAGLRGHVVRVSDDRELRLFAASFLTAATAALQDTRATMGVLGEAAIPLATARNAALAGTGAVLREYAQQMREAIARDGFYLRVPAGKPFYLYVTETIDRGRATPAAASLP